jgi:hypothetical protein
MKRRVIQFLGYCIRGVQRLYVLIIKDNLSTLYYPKINDQNKIEDLKSRFIFYTSGNYKILIPSSFIKALISNNPLFLLGDLTLWNRILLKFRKNIFRIDQFYNPRDGWEWGKYSSFISSSTPDLESVKNEFINYVKKIQSNNYTRAYLFGTGPSLEKAIKYSWKDGYRIVCNTIVRDRELWKHIDPHFIVAADAIYHFGFTAYAKAFRADLRKRLLESETKFIYPLPFHDIVKRELYDVADRLIPIPYGFHTIIYNDLTKEFSMPKVGNILNLLLLPLGCNLSKKIFLWGFDGRAPNEDRKSVV